MNEIARANWDLAMSWIEYADNSDNVNTAICYTGMAEFALKAARFAADYPQLVGGAPEAGIPVPLPGPDAPVPSGPTQGPKVWGTT